MVSNQGDGRKPRITATLPTNHKQALNFVAAERSQPGNRTYVAELVRESVEEYLANHWDELSEDAKELLDKEMLASEEAA